tara:strand:+ start:396 stop:755 length:360 start_codon:yes stop_codon:yes gene_type:complete
VVNKAFLYVAGVIIVALVTANALQWVETRSLNSDLINARAAKTLAEVNIASLSSANEALNSDIKGYKADVKALEAKRAEAKAEAAAQRVEHEAKVKAIRADLAKTPEEIRLKMIRNATR